MGQVLYRKYRSKSLDEVVGQEHITATLANALKTGKLAHAYLFTGPRGTGKTSIARILAHEINGLPYTDDATHLDIIEIDAASNRRIDEIRDLRDKVNIAPTSAKYKVYIIDEVHMLTREAFNALLKTLEEPPAHVVFILATTDAHKLPETIVSRTQRFTFRPVPLDQVVAHLQTIAKGEDIDVADDALQLIAAHGEGSFRDSISLLDQAAGLGEKIDLNHVQRLLGLPSAESIQQLADALAQHDAPAVVSALAQLHEQGFQSDQIAKQLSKVWRANILAGSHATATDFALLQQLLNVPGAHDPQRFLELILLEFALSQTPAAATAPVPEKPEPAPQEIEKPRQKPTEEPKKVEAEVEAEPELPATNPAKPVATDDSLWPQVLAALKQQHSTIYSVARMAEASLNGDTLVLGFAFPFHKKKAEETKNKQVIVGTIKQLSGKELAIEYKLIEEKPKQAAAEPQKPAPAKPADDITNISNIFGSAELLES